MRKPSVPASAISHELKCSIAQKGVKDKLYLRDDIDRIGKRTLDSGLTGSIYTRNPKTIHRAAKRMHTGYVWINNASQYFMGAPFGGVKQSGIGRKKCFAELMEFAYPKNVNLKLSLAEGHCASNCYSINSN